MSKSSTVQTEEVMGQKPLKAVSLFSGAGGMDIGVKNAGIEVLACLERDPHCCETLRTNIARKNETTRVLEGDIRAVDPSDLMALLGVKPGEIDLLFGGPPCQAFSQIGKQESIADERGMLLFEMARFATVLRPKVILIEQVKGLLSAKDHTGKLGGVFEMLLKELDGIGYTPKWRLINTADYGVPQLRKRVFIVATQTLNEFTFPSPTHQPSTVADLLFLLPHHVGVGEVLKGLSSPTRKNDRARNDSHVDVTTERDVQRIHGVPEGGHLSAQTHLPKSQVGNLSVKDTTKYLRLSRQNPSNTLRCGEIFFHPTQDRYLTPREYMRIHGYPDEYLLKGPIRSRSGRVTSLDQHRQVANSVPPPMAYALAKEIIRTISCQQSSRSSVIP